MKRTPPAKKPLVIGLLGGIASGKSTVSRWFAQWGATVLVADQIAHEVLTRPEVVLAVSQCFGEEVLWDLDKSKLDRKKIAGLVFGSSLQHAGNRSTLEGIVQPRVRDELIQRIALWRSRTSSPEAGTIGEFLGVASEASDMQKLVRDWLILDIPLLLEREWDSECDETLIVDTPRAMRLQFAIARGWTEEQFAMREATQWTIEQKKKHATHVIANDGTIDQLKSQVEAWCRHLAAAK
jgi:dephospho-CoA kinase